MEAIRLELCGGAPALEAAVVRAAELEGTPLGACTVSRVYLLDRTRAPSSSTGCSPPSPTPS